MMLSGNPPKPNQNRRLLKGRSVSKINSIKRLLARAGGSALSFIRWLKSRLLGTVSRKAGGGLSGADPGVDALQRLQAIMERRKSLEAQLESASKCSLIPDGIAECLLNCAVDELEVRRQMLIELQHQLQSCLRKLEAMAPPPKPEPEPGPTPPRPRRFTNFRDWLNGTPGLAK